VEEWLHVLAGTPVLRDSGGERTLRAGDLVAFPSGHVGAHTVAGPGRFVISSTGDHVEPWLSVYPLMPMSGAERLAPALIEVDPGEVAEPYHCECGTRLLRNGPGRDDVLLPGGEREGGGRRA
jgi:hypothetical protein